MERSIIDDADADHKSTSVHIGPKIINDNGMVEVDSIETKTENYFICMNCNKNNTSSCCRKTPSKRAIVITIFAIVFTAIVVGILGR